VARRRQAKVPKLAAIMDAAEPDVLAYMTFPKEHRAKLDSTNPIERLNGLPAIPLECDNEPKGTLPSF